MGYRGKKALVIKLAYIEAFNALEAELQRQRGALPPADALARHFRDRSHATAARGWPRPWSVDQAGSGCGARPADRGACRVAS
ncbi:MAG: hypothetical protein ACLS73_00310 [Bilophila wadsworthia]